MNRIVVYNTYKAKITIGLRVGYSPQIIDESVMIKHLQKQQKKLIESRNIYISANCYTSSVILGGMIEPHLNLEFINYPGAPLHEDDRIAEHIFNEVVENIAASLMEEFNQNRVVIQFHDCNLMLEKSKNINPRIEAQISI